MYENVAKSEFVNFLMNKKHSLELEKQPVLENLVKKFAFPAFFNEFNSEFKIEDLNVFLDKIDLFLKEKTFHEKEEDLLFGILYSCSLFTKAVKQKTFAYKEIADFYKKSFTANRKYMMEFNSKDQGKFDIAVPKEVVTRFPPEANGYLHIGHVKAALLNAHMAKDGKLLIRFDDTNPEKEEKKYEDKIIEDLSLLGIKDFKVIRTSDHFDEIYELAIKLIKKGKAFADNTGQETMRAERMEGIASKNRNADVETNLHIFKMMNEGKAKEFCLRAKIDYKNDNKALRDPVIYRFIDKEHYVTGKKYAIYPTYDFSCPIVDSLDKVTLTLRTNEYRDRNDQYYWFIDQLELENRPKIHDFSRLNFENTVLSKRKIKFYVDNNFVEGWDDPRIATLRGIKRLGLHMDALKEYIMKQGSSQKSSTISWDKIWAFNKKKIDLISARFSAVPFNGAVSCIIYKKVGGNEILISEKLEEVLKHQKNEELGTKTLYKSAEIFISKEDADILQLNEEFTLMKWGNAIVMEKTDNKIKLLENFNGDYKTTKNKISWVSKKGSILFKTYEFGTLQNDKNTEDLVEKFNTNSKTEEFWIGEKEFLNVKIGDFIQIERIGFFICDKNLEFNLIPYTKQKRRQ
ncbi:hypothetical protein NUSPORA_02517 [Nucleospora cyclopteri]